MSKPDDLVANVREMALAVGLHIIPGNPPFVYGPLDSIAILLDLLLFEDEQECSTSTKLYPLARAIAENQEKS